jgi:predicted dehydrogenase
MKTLSRRQFLRTTALTTVAAGLSARSWSQVAGANSDIRVAVVGFRSQGSSHLASMKGLPGVRLTALCDVDAQLLAEKARQYEGVETHTDIRKLLESKNVDALSIATPNHWHALATIWAVQAGKDVYVEKPVSHNVWEGRQMVAAARKYSKIVQTGTQSRSSQQGIRQAVEWVKAGNLGKINIARGLCYKRRDSIGKTTGPATVPANVDYDLWCGPAPLEQPRRNGKFGPVHYDWHWFWAYGSGDLGNQGIHQMDIARWFLGENQLAPRVLSLGGRLGYTDDAETPNTQIVYQEYAAAPLIFEVRGLPQKTDAKDMDKYKGGSVAVIIECEGGYVLVPNYTGATAHDKDGKEIMKWSGAENHHANFFKAVRSRKPGDLNADILEGHLSSALCHTGNISYRLGALKAPEEIKEAIKNQQGLDDTFGRMAEHLAANGVKLETDKIRLGLPLNFDPKTEQFTGNTAANGMLKRTYRAPFIVPEKV